MNSSLLEELQSKFKCSKCGKCCALGGDIVLDFDDVTRIAHCLHYTFDDFMRQDIVSVVDDHGHCKINDTVPCFFLDKFSRECHLQSCKPKACRDYPFKLYSQGGCNLDAVLTCPVAVKMLEDHLKGVE